MPIYKMEGKKDGLQRYRVRINYTDNTGKNRQLERVAYGREAAKDLETSLMREIKSEPCERITVSELYERYISSKEGEVKETTTDKTKKLLQTFVLPTLGEYKLGKLSMDVLQAWKDDIASRETGQGRKFSLKYKRNIFGELRAMLNYAVKMEYINRNPLSRLGTFKDTAAIKKEMDYYTAEEFLKFIKEARRQAAEAESRTGSISEWHYYVFFMIAFYTGMRKGEIYALKWTDINGSTIRITRSIAHKLRGGDRETSPKNKSSVRNIQMPKPLKKVIDEHYKRCKSVDGFTDDWRICGGQECIRDSTLSKRNEAYAAAAGVKKIRVHDYRHSHASLLVNSGINIQEIARRLGHSNVEITWNTYSHLYPQEENKAVDVLDKIK